MSGIWVRCPYCGHVWLYKGNKMYATCPNCYRKVNVEKNKVSEEDAKRLRTSESRRPRDLVEVLVLADHGCVKRVLSELGIAVKEGAGGLDTSAIDEEVAEKAWERIRKECIG